MSTTVAQPDMAAMLQAIQKQQGQPRNVPPGAARLQTWYVDHKGIHHDVKVAVPVDKENRRTSHRAGTCTTADCKTLEWVPKGEKRYCSIHRSPLSIAGDREARNDRAARRKALAQEMLMLHGSSALPWLLLICVAVAGLAGGPGLRALAVPAWYVALAAPLLYGVGYAIARPLLWRRAVELKRVQPGQRTGKGVTRVRAEARRVGAHAALIAVWVAVAASVDMLSTAGSAVWATLVVGWGMRSYPWWVQVDRRRSRGTPAPVAAPALPAGPAPLHPVAREAIKTWSELIGQQGGPLAGTVLTDVVLLPAVAAGGPDRARKTNFTGVVRAVVAGAIDMRANRPGLLGRINSAYGVSGGDVSFAADPNDQSIAYLRVCPDNPLAEVRLYAGPDSGDWRRGWSVVGRFDDAAPLIYAWWTETGAVHDLVSGCTGSGKSELVLQLILRSLHSNGLIVDWLGDPQGGQSYGAVKQHVAWFAPSKDEIRLMLIGALMEMDRRTQALSAANIKTWRASRDMPLIVITLDEVQRYIEDPAIAELVTGLVGQGRKAGIKMRLITQVPAAYALGGTIYIKEQLMSGQTFTFRAETELAGRHASEGDDLIDPRSLPKRWGKWTCGEGKTTAGLVFVRGVYGRDLFARVDYTGEDMAVWLYDAQGNLTASPGEFSDDAQAVSGVLWAGRWQRAALVGRRDTRSLLTTADAAELIRAAEDLAAVGYDVSQVVTPENASGAGATARDLVHAVAAQAAAGHPEGLAERQAIIAATPGMAASTRDGAIGDLVAARSLKRVRNGVYELLRPAPAGVVLPATDPADDDLTDATAPAE